MKNHYKYYIGISLTYILLIGVTLFSLTACTPERVLNITNITDIIWYSNNPKIEILILKENQGGGFGKLSDNGVNEDICFYWGYARFRFGFASQYEMNPSPLPSGEYPSMQGGYRVISDTEVHFKIDYDTMFSGKYLQKTFIMKSEKINPKNIDAIYRINVCWESAIPSISFQVLPTERRRGKGKIEHSNQTYDIIFYWEEDSRFSVYELQNDLQSQSPILSGTYVSENLKATLTIEEDSIFNHEFDTIQLVAKGLNDP